MISTAAVLHFSTTAGLLPPQCAMPASNVRCMTPCLNHHDCAAAAQVLALLLRHATQPTTHAYETKSSCSLPACKAGSNSGLLVRLETPHIQSRLIHINICTAGCAPPFRRMLTRPHIQCCSGRDTLSAQQPSMQQYIIEQLFIAASNSQVPKDLPTISLVNGPQQAKGRRKPCCMLSGSPCSYLRIPCQRSTGPLHAFHSCAMLTLCKERRMHLSVHFSLVSITVVRNF
jgi:hypothetical protein